MRPFLPSNLISRAYVILFALIPILGLGQTQTLTFNSSSSWIVPCGVTSVTVQAWGGGGGGAGDGTNAGNSGSGGGGGGYSTGIIAVTAGSSIAYTVGAGGAGGGGNANGSNGFTTIFSTVSAPGGAGGAFNSGAGGAGGIGNAGTGGTGTIGGAVGGTGGQGANSGGAGGIGSSGLNGTSGASPGGGGGGGDDEGGGTRDGGAGGAGRIIITWTGPYAGPDQNLAACATSATLAANTPAGAGSTGTWTCVSGCTGVTFSNANSPSSTVNGLTPGTNTVLQWTWTGGGAGCTSSNDQVTINTTQGPGCWVYCTNDFPTGVYSISNVTFGTINNTTAVITGGTTPDAENYTAQSTDVTLNTSYPISVTANGAAGNTFCVMAFFDWNNDGDFTDAGESFTIGTYTTASATLSSNITVPAGATLGATNFRIIQHFSTCATPCETAGYGQSETYSVNILGCTTTTPLAGADQNLLSCVNSTSLAGNAVGVGETGTWTLMSGAGTITSPNSPTSGVTNLGPGANVFRWTIQSANPACPDLFDEVTINTLNLSTVANAGVDTETCNTSFALSANAPGGGETGLWSVSPAGPTILPINSNTATISGMAPTTAYTLTWTITNGLCPSSDNVTITTIAGVTAANAGPDQSGLCTGSAINLAGNNPANGVGTWTGAGGIIADPSSPTTAVNALNTAGSYTYTWTVSAPGCVSSVDQVVLNVAFCDPNITTVTCPGPVVFSDGGATYANNEHIVQKYCPSTPGQFITATFSQMTMSSSADHMIVLNGANYSAPVIDDFYSLPTINGGANTITSSASDGCLTFIFLSNASLTAAGWTANITCTPTAGTGNVAECNPTNCLGGCLRTICGVPATVPFTGDGVGAEELNAVDGGCLGAGETCSNWFLINPTNAGTLTLNMFVNAGQDQDFAVWEAYDPLLECPAMTGDAPLICNFAGSTAQGTGFNSVTQALPNPAYEPTLNISAAQITAGVYYIILVNTYNNGGACPQPDVSITFGGTAGLSCDPPIALGDEDILLAGSADGNMNHLTWQVEVETTITSYVLERSKNGTDWTTVGVRSSNKSVDGSEYFMYDESPYAPFTYYRVKGYNTNGEEKSSNIISISKGEMGDFWVSELFPNPTSDEVSFQYQGKNFNEPVNVEIYNSIGQLVLTESIDVINQMSGITLRTEALANGTYQVIITQGEQKMHKKLSIIR